MRRWDFDAWVNKSNVGVDADLQSQSEALFGTLGMNLGTAINVFLRKAVRVGGFPFDVSIDSPNRETIEAMIEAERIARDTDVKAYSVDDAFMEKHRELHFFNK